MLLNHFKSQSGGGGAKRARQAQGVRDIVDGLIADGETNMVVMGDFNEGPTALGQVQGNLAPLFDPAGPLVDAYSLPTFILDRDQAVSRAAGSGTVWTTSSFHTPSPPGL